MYLFKLLFLYDNRFVGINILGVRNITLRVSKSETVHRDNILSLGSMQLIILTHSLYNLPYICVSTSYCLILSDF